MVVLRVRFEQSPQLRFMLSAVAWPSDTMVIIQSKRGPELATVRGEPLPLDDKERYGQIVGKATTADLQRWKELKQKATEIKWALRATVRRKKLDLKVADVTFSLDEQLVTISYTTEQRIELGWMIEEIREYTAAKVNFLFVTPREQAQILGALGACGRENCSSQHLQEVLPITIRLARDQQLPLNTEKLSGPCGRLLCCLQFEHEQYKELLKALPKRNSHVCHETGCGKVIKLHPLLGTVDIATKEGVLYKVPANELKKTKPS